MREFILDDEGVVVKTTHGQQITFKGFFNEPIVIGFISKPINSKEQVQLLIRIKKKPRISGEANSG